MSIKPSLTPREESIIRAIASGQSNSEIARDLHISVKTVERYVTRLLRKLGVRSRVEIATWWLREGIFLADTDQNSDEEM